MYHLPYDPKYPVVCMDESNKQLIGEVSTPIPCKPGYPARIDDEYVRNGVEQIFMEVEPLAGKRHVVLTERTQEKIGRNRSSRCLINDTLKRLRFFWLWIISTRIMWLLFIKRSIPMRQDVWPNVLKFIKPRNTEVGSTWQKLNSVP